MFNRVSAVVLFVRDFDKSLEFYRDKVGLPVTQLEHQFAAFKLADQDFALNTIENGADLVGIDADAVEPLTGKVSRALLCTQVENVDEAYETLKASGVEFTKAPVDQYWGIRAAYFRDPDGNVWEIAQPIPAK